MALYSETASVTAAFTPAVSQQFVITDSPDPSIWAWMGWQTDFIAVRDDEQDSAWRWSDIIFVDSEVMHSTWAWGSVVQHDMTFPTPASNIRTVGISTVDDVVLSRA